MGLILLGPPGCGKGTQAFALKDALNLEHLSTGDLFRNAITNKTTAGLEAKSFIDQGLLVPDEITSKILKEALVSSDKDFLLDGFPRTINQAETLEGMSREHDFPIDAVLNFQVPEEILIERLTGRRICPKDGSSYHLLNRPPKVEGICDLCGSKLIQRPDDNEKSAIIRLNEYNSKTKPLIDFYTEKGILINIDANLAVEECTKSILEALGFDND